MKMFALIAVLVLAVAGVFFLLTILPSLLGEDEAEAYRDYQMRRSLFASNLNQITDALTMYIGENGKFPDDIRDKSGATALSWRVRLLPYLGENELYRRFHLDKPWSSEENKGLINEMPPRYFYHPCRKEKDLASKGFTVFQTLRSAAKGGVQEVPRDTEIVVIESTEPVIWTRPADVNVDKSEFPIEIGNWKEPGGYVGYLKRKIEVLPVITKQANIFLQQR